LLSHLAVRKLIRQHNLKRVTEERRQKHKISNLTFATPADAEYQDQWMPRINTSRCQGPIQVSEQRTTTLMARWQANDGGTKHNRDLPPTNEEPSQQDR
jgi:hypothetical protein